MFHINIQYVCSRPDPGLFAEKSIPNVEKYANIDQFKNFVVFRQKLYLD
jgi:hypothetical protein